MAGDAASGGGGGEHYGRAGAPLAVLEQGDAAAVGREGPNAAGCGHLRAGAPSRNNIAVSACPLDERQPEHLAQFATAAGTASR